MVNGVVLGGRDEFVEYGNNSVGASDVDVGAVDDEDGRREVWVVVDIGTELVFAILGRRGGRCG